MVHVEAAAAMTIEKIDWNGRDALILTGAIEPGDSTTFAAAISQVRPSAHGLPIVLLDSPGGHVETAMAISRVMDENPVHTIIPFGGRCASACASILFIAGNWRTIEEGGLMGQHSCSIFGVANDACNERLAQHAVEHGVAHGAVAAFVTYIPPDDIGWLDRTSADCWSITRYPFESKGFFGRSHPCFDKAIAGKYPPSGTEWRLDILGSGWRAFLRPVHDHVREMEISVHCDERQPGHLFLSMDIGGPRDAIEDAVKAALLVAPGIFAEESLLFQVVQVDPVYTRLTATLPKQQTIPFFTKVQRISFALILKSPYEPMIARTTLAGSRDVLLFAANHCENR
jgi:hypothetical protein